MGSQTKSGKAFEYGMLKALESCIGEKNCRIIEDQSIKTARADFESHPAERQSDNFQAGVAASDQLLKFEPYLQLAQQGKLIINLGLQSDMAGAAGDVRDILISIPERGWEIGISAKHQHEALKHSRLSNQIDFGQKWFGIPCSKTYFNAIQPIFTKLKEYKMQGLAWSELSSKDTDIYAPILSAFKSEVLNLEQNNPTVVAPGLVSYLIGLKDFYKVVKLKRKTKIQVFNFSGTLNSSVQNIQPETRLEKLKLPTRIVEVDFRKTQTESSHTTLDMICDAGWQLSFRLHNASTKVEASLKFDINLVGRPNNLETFTVGW